MLMLLLLATDFGRLFFTYVAVNNAAREGTQYASLHASDSSYDLATYKAGIVAAATRETNMQAQGGEGSLTVGDPSCYSPATDSFLDCHVASDFAPGIGNQVTVTVAQPFSFITPLIGYRLRRLPDPAGLGHRPGAQPARRDGPAGSLHGAVADPDTHGRPDADADACAHPDAGADPHACAGSHAHPHACADADADPHAAPDVHGARLLQHLLPRPGRRAHLARHRRLHAAP